MSLMPIRVAGFFLALVTGFGTTVGRGALGQIIPPPGPVGKSFKTLDQVKPGRPISSLASSAEAAAVIDAPGLYYLDRDLEVPSGKKGLVISFPILTTTSSQSVMIDMGAFSIVGAPGGSAGGGALEGISYSSLGLQPRGGDIIIHASGGAISGFTGDGVHIEGAASLEMHGVSIRHCGGNAVTGVFDPSKWTKIDNSDTTVEFVGGRGLDIQGASSVVIVRCVAQDTVSDAVYVRVPAGTLTPGKPYVFTLSASSISKSGGAGVRVEGMTEVTCQDVSVSGASGNGFDFKSADDMWTFCGSCAAASCGQNGFFTISPRDQYDKCRADSCALDGFHNEPAPPVAAAIQPRAVLKSYFECTSTGNGRDGFSLTYQGAAKNIGTYVSCTAGQNARHGLIQKFENGDIPQEDDFVDVIDSFCVGNGEHGFTFTDTAVSMKGGGASGNGGAGMRSRIDALEARLQAFNLLATTVSGNGASGVDVSGGSLSVRDCTISKNGAGLAGGGGGGGGDGVRAYLVGDTVIYNSVIYQCARHGVSVSNSGKIYIVGGYSSRNGTGAIGDGVHIETCTGAKLESADCQGNHADGWNLLQVDSVAARSCTDGGNHRDGWNLLQCDRVSITGSTSSGNGRNGMTCDHSNVAAVLNGNVLIGNGLSTAPPTPGSTGGSGAVFTNCGSLSITATDFSRSGGDGLHVDVCKSVSVSNCMSKEVCGNGYAMSHALDASVDGSEGSGNGACGAAGTPGGGGGGGGGAVFLNCGRVRVSSSTFSGNSADGLTVGINEPLPFATLHVSKVTATGNAGLGVGATCSWAGGSFASVRMQDCMSSSNGGWGISCDGGVSHATLEDNSCEGNGGAMQVLGSGCFVRSNVGTLGPLGGFSFSPAVVAGPLVDGSSLGADCNRHSNVLH